MTALRRRNAQIVEARFDDWVTETRAADGKKLHGLKGDILVCNYVTRRRHELSSMGIPVNAETLKTQLEVASQTDFLKFPYHKGIVKNEILPSIDGGIGQSPPSCCCSERRTNEKWS